MRNGPSAFNMEGSLSPVVLRVRASAAHWKELENRHSARHQEYKRNETPSVAIWRSVLSLPHHGFHCSGKSFSLRIGGNRKLQRGLWEAEKEDVR